jgi:hypothetical protein
MQLSQEQEALTPRSQMCVKTIFRDCAKRRSYVTAGSDLIDAALRFRPRLHKPITPDAKSGNVPGSGTDVTTGAPVTPAIKVSGPVPKEKVAPVIVVSAVIPGSARVNATAPSTKGLNMPFVIEALAFG